MGRRGFHGRPDAPAPKAPPVAVESAPALPLAPVAPPPSAPSPVLPVVSPDALTEANARIDALTADRAALAARVAELTAECSSLVASLAAANNDRASLAAQVEALTVEAETHAEEVKRLRASVASAEATALAAMGDEPAAVVRVPYVLSGIRYNGRTYDPPERFPFDPKRPPEGVIGEFYEGVHFVYRDA